MDSVWLNVFSVLFVFSMAIISPGPNFVLVLNTALNRSRREVMYTALGVAIGSTLFAVAGLFGLILILDSSPFCAPCSVSGQRLPGLSWFDHADPASGTVEINKPEQNSPLRSA